MRAEHNFELGAEFEVILCKLLRRLLPRQYGVCRGYLTNSKGEVAGDDIVIFNQARFPTIALRGDDDYSRKEYIPIEAACCYVEAKYTLNVRGDDGQSLTKALSQVGCAKQLCTQREQVPLSALSPYHNVEGLAASMPEGWPEQRNPLFTAIIASAVRERKGATEPLSAVEARDIIVGSFKTDQNSQDLCVLGERLIGIPAVPLANGGRKVMSPFQVHGKTAPMLVALNEDNAFALGLVHLLWALDWIQLGKIPWSDIVRDTLERDAAQKS
ncbi:MAG: hypothetical protein A2Y76_15505 [Planctomycetes bacterium RBG_13_60_9]|nr:MAG: hypothetical protein A2Y76_15505 [Planctomycetes bacterium RBG_13_60_9]